MNGLAVITSRSLSRLIDSLASGLSATPKRVLERETIVVLNPGMARWISMELALRQGVSAGLDFRFPNEVLDACFRAVLPGVTHPSPFTREAMAWRIAARLPGLLGRPGFEPIAGYLRNRQDDRRLIQIARVLADLFDQYIIFRPEMILAWDRGNDRGWQPTLWREISSGCAGQHRAALLEAFRARIRSGGVPEGLLPGRLRLFGISYLPPFHLQAFSLLSAHTAVTFYLQNPCGTYWGDLVSRQRLAELAVRQADAGEYFDAGNPLLSSLGTMGQEFHDLLLECGFDTLDLDDEGSEPEPVTLLETVQSDIRQLRDRGGRDGTGEVPPGDRSLQVHACHGPLREMEVLYDNLLAMFATMEGLEPRQIVVMTPDIERYAPYIAAVFGAASAGRPAIPFTIADRSSRHESRSIQTFFRLLDLPAGRLGVTQVLELLECPAVAAHFGIRPDELELIRRWLAETGVRWGFDAAQRSELGFPAYEEFSWQAALKRLFLGYALAPDGDRLFGGLLPCDAVEGQGAAALGKLAEFLRAAQAEAGELLRSRPPAAWADHLTGLIQRLMSLEDCQEEMKALFSALQELRAVETNHGFEAPLSLAALQDCLNSLLEGPSAGFSFLGGRVTFCAMLPMRSIPFRVVCLVGMDDGIFPRTRRDPSFSQLQERRRRGDRSLRDEDRYLFLETLLAAGERLYISYTGQSDRDNSILPPSVVVSELLDYLQRGFRTAGTPSPPDVVTRHRLQPFSSAYFSGTGLQGPLFSFASEYAAALQGRQAAGPLPRHFISRALPDDPALLESIRIEELKRFLANPAALFLSRRLNVRPHSPAPTLDEREPFTLEGLGAYGLRQELVERALQGADTTECYAVARARGLLPPLGPGRALFERLQRESREFSQAVAGLLGDDLEPLPISFLHDGIGLTGTLGGIRAGRHVVWRCAGMRARDRLALWIDHLILSALAPAGYPTESLLVCRDRTLTFAPLPDAAAVLADLLELYREGLRRPLPFFPQTSWLYLTEGPEKAAARWEGSDYSPLPAEAADPSFSLCFGSPFPGGDFARLAARVFEPLRQAATEEKRA